MGRSCPLGLKLQTAHGMWVWLLCAGLSVSATLCGAQVADLVDVPDPPALPSPSLLEKYVLENPLPLAVGLVLASLIVGAIARARDKAQQRRVLGMVSLGLFCAGIGVYGAGRLATTPREHMMQATRELVGAVAEGDSQAVRRELTSGCTLTYFDAPLGIPVQAILSRVEEQFKGNGMFVLEDYKIRAIRSVEDRTGYGRVQVKVWAKAKSGFPVNSWWSIDYTREGEEWKASAIQAISISGMRGR